MLPDITWITPLYGFGPHCKHIGVPEEGRAKLQEMADELVGSQSLVAIYIPQGTDEVYKPGGMRGRVVGAVQLVRMPPRRRMEDYYYKDWDASLRWPIGWPCQPIYAPEVDQCPILREHVEHFGWNLQGYVSRFQHGPFRLDAAMRDRLNRDFSQFILLATAKQKPLAKVRQRR